MHTQISLRVPLLYILTTSDKFNFFKEIKIRRKFCTDFG